jgi:hypothetical protein
MLGALDRWKRRWNCWIHYLEGLEQSHVSHLEPKSLMAPPQGGGGRSWSFFRATSCAGTLQRGVPLQKYGRYIAFLISLWFYCSKVFRSDMSMFWYRFKHLRDSILFCILVHPSIMGRNLEAFQMVVWSTLEPPQVLFNKDMPASTTISSTWASFVSRLYFSVDSGRIW